MDKINISKTTTEIEVDARDLNKDKYIPIFIQTKDGKRTLILKITQKGKLNLT
ncbi:MAG: hypothetical protein ACHQYP_11020 [Nitrospiria bacterium]